MHERLRSCSMLAFFFFFFVAPDKLRLVGVRFEEVGEFQTDLIFAYRGIRFVGRELGSIYGVALVTSLPSAIESV